MVRASTPANIEKLLEAAQLLEEWEAAVKVYS
jgi:hypothetical protein